MCYAIPGKIVEISDGRVTVDYFGERKKARNDFLLDLAIGDYIYAQGGFVVGKIPPEDAASILETWEDLFFKLQSIDLQLTREPKNLYQKANFIRQKHIGNSCCVHGILEFSNYCSNNCLYCGIRRENITLKRYRLDVDEIVEICDYAVHKLGFKALVLQSGEDSWYTSDKLVNIVEKVRENCPALIVLSIGEREKETFERLYHAGARGVLLRFETGNPEIYKKLKPESSLEERLNLIRSLRGIGYIIMTGFLVGLPEQTEDDILNDIELTNSLDAEMFSFGPFIPHPQTPLANTDKPSLEVVLTTIAHARIMFPDSRILVTTALETLDKEDGARLGLLSGGNSLMINVTPEKYRCLYEIYPYRAGTDLNILEKIERTIELLHSLGRAPTDLE